MAFVLFPSERLTKEGKRRRRRRMREEAHANTPTCNKDKRTETERQRDGERDGERERQTWGMTKSERLNPFLIISLTVFRSFLVRASTQALQREKSRRGERRRGGER
jgi:hypothetical protein